MKILYNWLKKYIGKKQVFKKSKEFSKKSFLETKGIEDPERKLDGVVAGKVLEKRKHPNADKLSLVKVQVGGGEILNIVCGAPNIEAGRKVAVALVGASLPCGIKIAERTIRGVESCGMICAEDELGLGKSHEGIMVLSEDSEVGAPIAEVLKNTRF